MSLEILKSNYESILLRNIGKIANDGIKGYISSGGYSALKMVLSMTPDAVLPIIREAGLRKRSGEGAFIAPLMTKCLEQTGAGKYFICNGTDGDPVCEISAFLLENDPHSVLEGIIISAYATGAEKGILCINPGKAVDIVENALKEAVAGGFTGEGILGTSYSFELELRIVDKAYINSEESALLNGLEGKTLTSGRTNHITETGQPFPGLFAYEGSPAVVVDAEALANIPVIIQRGAGWYKGIGTENCTGTKLFCINGSAASCGLVEVPFGTTIRSIIYDVCGGIKEGSEIKALLVGGPMGGFFTPEGLDVMLDFDHLKEAGAVTGTGSIVIYDTGSCIVNTVKECMSFSRMESCGKCVFCREGTFQLQEILSDITSGKSRTNDLEMLADLCEGMAEGSFCAQGKAAPNPVITSLKLFGEEYEAHMKRRRCTAMVCKKYITYHVLPDKCTGCGDCMEKCPEEAIEGDDGMIHVIDADSCTKCGLCLEICSSGANAIVKAGPVKPMTPKEPVKVGSWRKR